MRLKAHSLWVLILVSWPAIAPANPIREALAACLQTLEALPPSDKPGLDLAKHCPGLTDQLNESPYGAWLPHEWSTGINSREQIAGLERLLSGAEQTSVQAEPDVSRVASVLEGMQRDEAARELSIWERIVKWAWARFQSQGDEAPPWLKDLFDRMKMSPGEAHLLSNVLLTLVVIVALLAIVNELRAAGAFGKRGARSKNALALGAAAHGAAGLRLADVDGAPLRLQPSLLLELLLKALAREQVAASNSSLTHRELKSAVTVQGEEPRAEFDNLVGCAERSRYGETEPTEQELSSAVTAGRKLLARFS